MRVLDHYNVVKLCVKAPTEAVDKCALGTISKPHHALFGGWFLAHRSKWGTGGIRCKSTLSASQYTAEWPINTPISAMAIIRPR